MGVHGSLIHPRGEKSNPNKVSDKLWLRITTLNTSNILPDRLTVGRQTLNLSILVRIQFWQLGASSI